MFKPEGLNYVPSPTFRKRSVAAELMSRVRRKEEILTPDDQQSLRQAVTILKDPRMQELIAHNQVTFGAIKPKSNESPLFQRDGITDDRAASVIFGDVEWKLAQERSSVLFAVSVAFTEEQLKEFYGPNKQKMKAMKIADQPGRTEWDRLIEFGTSGPVTLMFIYREEGEAIQTWRKIMGKTFPSRADEGTIRNKYAGDKGDSILPNNFTHGSDDTPGEVAREIDVVTKVLKSLLRKPSHAAL